jgi:hypothetical protein
VSLVSTVGLLSTLDLSRVGLCFDEATKHLPLARGKGDGTITMPENIAMFLH